MKAIDIGNHKFINESHIVSFTYAPSETRPRQKEDSYGAIVHDGYEIIESELVLTLSTGTNFSLHGKAADELYTALTARLVSPG